MRRANWFAGLGAAWRCCSVVPPLHFNALGRVAWGSTHLPVVHLPYRATSIVPACRTSCAVQGDQYDVREKAGEREVRNLGKPVELAARYFEEGADEVAFLNITGFRWERGGQALVSTTSKSYYRAYYACARVPVFSESCCALVTLAGLPS